MTKPTPAIATPPADLAPLLALPAPLAKKLADATRSLDALVPVMAPVFDHLAEVLAAVDSHRSQVVGELEVMQLPERTLWNVREAIPYLNGASVLSDRIFELHERLGVICGELRPAEPIPGAVYDAEGALVSLPIEDPR